MPMFKAKAILTDIEGTTSSISFVRDVLFPYAAEHLPMFVRANAQDPVVLAQMRAVAQEIGAAESDCEAIIAALLQWIAEDRKTTPLKTLQGMLWEHGYKNAAYSAHVYEDAFKQLSVWHAAGVPLFVYSSGSIQAQQLFFGYSEFGDLTPLFSNYFDTTSGAKQEAASYQRIAEVIQFAPADVLFLSDIAAELDAAKAAGMQTCWLVRPQDNAADDKAMAASVHPAVRDFSKIIVSSVG
ncbi:MAG: acireductone synthase [Pseudomonadales bacterium]